MIEPTLKDIGRGVIYHGYAGERERGVISSFNDAYVFVRYGAGCTAAATKREQLEWEFPKDSPRADYPDLPCIVCGAERGKCFHTRSWAAP